MSECKCDMRTKLVGDGCAHCNPELVIDLLKDERDELAQRIAELEANNARLRDAILMHKHRGGDPYLSSVLKETPADSLAAVRREAMEKARDQMINVVENFWNLVDESDPADMARVMRETKFYG